MSKILSIMLELENFSGEQLRKIVIQITFICTLLLFGVTGWVQFSCYPMVTGGSLPERCNNQTTKLNIIKDQRTHGNVLINLASDPDSDEDVLTALMSSLDSPRVANNPRILERAIAFNPKTPTDALEALTKSEDVAILSQIVARQNATPDVLRKVANNPTADVYTVQKAFVDNSKTPEDVLQKIALSKEVKILSKVIKHPQVSVEVLRKVADNSAANDVRIQQMLASNSKAPEDILQNLANSKNPKVLLAVTKNPHTSSAVLEIVADNSTTKEDILIQQSLASNPNIPGKVAEKLADSEDGNVLWDLYHNPNPNVLSPELKRFLEKRLPLDPVPFPEPDDLPSPPENPTNPFPEDDPPCPPKHVQNTVIGVGSGVVGGLGTLGLIGLGIIAADVILLPLGIAAGVAAVVTGGLEIVRRCKS